jgi:hypothetical protein
MVGRQKNQEYVAPVLTEAGMGCIVANAVFLLQYRRFAMH